MYKLEVPTQINRIVALFYGLRVWNRDGSNFTCATVLTLLQTVSFVSFVASCIIGATITPHKQEMVFLTNFSILTGTHAVRMVYIVWKRAEILQFINEVGALNTDDIDEFTRISNKIRALLKFAEIFVLACSFEVALVMISPLFIDQPMVNIAFPWEKTGLAFWISHFIVSLGSVYSVIWFLLSVIIWYLMTNCSLKYQLLGNQLREMGKAFTKDMGQKAHSSEQQQQLFMEDLIISIKAHRRINCTMEHFSSTFSIFFFIQTMTSSIAICAGVYNLAFNSNESLLEDAFNYVFSMYNLFDIFVVMYLGNEIKLSRDRMSCCLFESNWIEQSSTTKNFIIIMTEVLKRQQEIIVGKLYPLNLETFMSIVNAAYRSFNVLRQW